MPTWLVRRAILSLTIVVGLSSFLPGIARAEAIEADTNPIETVAEAPTATEPTTTETPIVEPVVETLTTEPIVTEPTAIAPSEETTGAIEEEDSAPTITEATKDFTNIVPQTTEYTCGPAALATLILQKGGNADEMNVAELSGTTEEKGTTLLGLKKAAEALGYKAAVKKWSATRLKSATLPVLVHDKTADGTEHYSVITAFTEDGVSIADTAAGNIVMSEEDFATFYSGKALTIEAKTRITSDMSVDAALNIIAANPKLANNLMDENGNPVSLEDLEDMADADADAIHGKGAETMVLSLAAIPFIPEISAVGLAIIGTVTVIAGVITFSSSITSWLYKTFTSVRNAVNNLIDKAKSGSGNGSDSGSSQSPKLPPNIAEIVAKAGLTGTTIHGAEQLAKYPDRLPAYEKIAEVMSRGKLYYDVSTGASVRVYERFLVLYNASSKALITAYKAGQSYIDSKIQTGTWIIK